MNKYLGKTKLDERIAADFSRVRVRALINLVIAFLSGKQNNLLAFDEVQRALQLRDPVYLGTGTVEMTLIRGCVNRCLDFDKSFLPTRTSLADRWKRTARAHYQIINLPPPILLKVGDIYFVYDGFNRVSVARMHGVKLIEAEIIEYTTPLHVDRFFSQEDLDILSEYADFIEETNLAQLRPEQDIRFSQPGGYRTLIQHIETHHDFLELERLAHVSWEEAVAQWYDHVYMPMLLVIREREVLAHFPGRTDADLYVRIVDHLVSLEERHGPEVTLEMASDDFIQQFSRKSNLGQAGKLRRSLTNLGRVFNL